MITTIKSNITMSLIIIVMMYILVMIIMMPTEEKQEAVTLLATFNLNETGAEEIVKRSDDKDLVRLNRRRTLVAQRFAVAAATRPRFHPVRLPILTPCFEDGGRCWIRHGHVEVNPRFARACVVDEHI